MTIKSFYPGLNRLLVKETEMPVPKDNILSIPDKQFKYGVIEAVGSIKDRGDIDETTFKVNDEIYFPSRSGISIELPCGTYKLLNIQDVLVGKRVS